MGPKAARSNVLLQGYSKANSNNVPKIDEFMTHDFFIKDVRFVSTECRSVKLSRAAETYFGDNAIGYPQLKRCGDLCTVRAQCTPQMSVHSKSYTVEVVVNEKEGNIVSGTCFDCAASLGGCKHVVGLVFWIHRRAMEPSPTEVKCYWAKSKLSCVSTSALAYITSKEITPRKKSLCQLEKAQNSNNDLNVNKANDNQHHDEGFLEQVIRVGRHNDSRAELIAHYNPNPLNDELGAIELHSLLMEYDNDFIGVCSDTFLDFCSKRLTPEMCRKVQESTVNQSQVRCWYRLRIGRITASKIYEAAHCQTDGSLVAIILGGKTVIDTKAMKRGRDLERPMIEAIAKRHNMKILPVGLMLDSTLPEMGASPDGLTDEFVIEVKCPMKASSRKYFISITGQATPKVFAQIQMQMHFCKRRRGMLCVAAHDFESTSAFETVNIEYDADYVLDITRKARSFWQKFVFPKLISYVTGA